MSLVVRWAPPYHYEWLTSKIGCSPTHAFRALEALREDGSIAGMIGFDLWWGNAAHMHFACEDSISLRKLLPAAFKVVFDKREIVVGWVPRSFAGLLEMAKRVGFKEIGVVADGWRKGDDMIMLELRKTDCRWLERN